MSYPDVSGGKIFVKIENLHFYTFVKIMMKLASTVYHLSSKFNYTKTYESISDAKYPFWCEGNTNIICQIKLILNHSFAQAKA
jgi:hypothetical protein